MRALAAVAVLVGLVIFGSVAAHPSPAGQHEHAHAEFDEAANPERIDIHHFAPYDDALPGTAADLVNFDRGIKPRNGGCNKLHLPWANHSQTVGGVPRGQREIKIIRQRHGQDVGGCSHLYLIGWGKPVVHNTDAGLKPISGYRALGHNANELDPQISPALQFVDLLLPVGNLALDSKALFEPFNISGHGIRNALHGGGRPRGLPDGSLHVAGLVSGDGVHLVDGLLKPPRLNAKDYELEGPNSGQDGGQPYHPDIGIRFFLAVSLFLGGFLLSLWGLHRPDNHGRVIRAALIGGGWLLGLLGMGLCLTL